MNLKKYTKGEHLPYPVLQKMPNGAVVWVVYHEYGNSRAVVNRAHRVTKEGKGWHLEGGTLCDGDFEHTGEKAGHCLDENDGGVMELFYAIEKPTSLKR
jgi:hypothetical protein